jgi:hypothetical protein
MNSLTVNGLRPDKAGPRQERAGRPRFHVFAAPLPRDAHDSSHFVGVMRDVSQPIESAPYRRNHGAGSESGR